jgi:small-conductance mechanosensitive channel/CRP-like cAMP-binding protein
MMSILFAVETVLIVGLVKSPLHPVYPPQDLPGRFWIQVLICCWWMLAARELVSSLALPTMLRRATVENKLLSNVIAGSVYICAGLAMLGLVFELPLQGVLATSGIIAIVLGLALQSTLADVFSGLSLNIAKPFKSETRFFSRAGAEGKVLEINWRSTHLRNSANDLVIVPNSAIAKMRIQNHSGGMRRYDGSLTIAVDSRNEPELALETLKQATVTCPSILDHPEPSVAIVDFKADRITYEISFSTVSIATAGDARSQLIMQIYKRARPALSAQDSLESRPIYLFPESELFNHIPLLEPLTPSEKADLNAKIIRRPFRTGEELLAKGAPIKAVQFVFSGVIEVTRQLQDGRKLKVATLGPGDSFGGLSLLTGLHTEDLTLISRTPGLLLGLILDDLEPILRSRPELVELLSHSVSKQQQILAMLDQTAMEPVVVNQPDLLWHIKKFFHLERVRKGSTKGVGE